jgi:tetratricopeptide (TPR) repeat protein
MAAADTPALFEKARSCEQSADWRCAEAAYRSFLKQEPASPEAYSNLGVVLARQEKFAEAVQAYTQALRLLPALTAIRLNLGLAYYKAGQLAPAIRQFRLYLEKDPENRQARQLLATAFLESDQYEPAAKVFESLLPSEDLSIRLGLATSYARLKRTAEARRWIEEAIRDQNSAEVHLAVGQAYLAANDFQQAEDALRKALELKPSLVGAHFSLGAARWKQQDEEGAIGEWRAELKLGERNFEALFALGAILAEKGRYEEAKALLTRARQMRPAHAATLFYLGKLLWKQHRDGALALLEKSANLDPENRQARFLLAQVYKAQGRKVEAARELEAVRKLAAKGVQRDIEILERVR